MSLDVLSFVTGVAEGDLKAKERDFETALENFRDDKKLHQTLAAERYTRNVNKYEEEVAKMENIDKIYSEAAKLDKNSAAAVISQFENPTIYKSLAERDDGSLEAFISSYANSFEDTKDADGNVTGFKISRKNYILNEPNKADYFKGKDFWDKEAKNIKSGTTSFLGNEIRKLFDKEPKTVDSSNYLAELNAKQTADIKSFVNDNNEPLKDKDYFSSVVTDSSSLVSFNMKRFEKNNPSWVGDHKELMKSVKWDSSSKRDNFLNFLSTTDFFGATTEANFKLKNNDTEIDGVTPAARGMLATYKAVYNSVVQGIDARTLAANGVLRTDLPNLIDVGEINKQVARIFEQRGYSETYGDEGINITTNADFIGVLPYNVVDASGNITIGDNVIKANDLEKNILTQYKEFLETEGQKRGSKLSGNKLVNAMNDIQSSIRIGGDYYNKFIQSIDTKTKTTTTSTITNEGDNVPQVVENDGVSGITMTIDGKKRFKSWEQLETDGTITGTLEKYPSLKSEYNSWKSSQSN